MFMGPWSFSYSLIHFLLSTVLFCMCSLSHSLNDSFLLALYVTSKRCDFCVLSSFWLLATSCWVFTLLVQHNILHMGPREFVGKKRKNSCIFEQSEGWYLFEVLNSSNCLWNAKLGYSRKTYALNKKTNIQYLFELGHCNFYCLGLTCQYLHFFCSICNLGCWSCFCVWPKSSMWRAMRKFFSYLTFLAEWCLLTR